MSTSPISAVAGTQGKVSIDGTVMYLTKWSVTPQAKMLETTNFGSTQDGTCYQEFISGVVGCDITFEGVWDLNIPPYGTLYPGQIVEDVSLYISATSDVSWDFDEVIVATAPSNTDINDLAKISFTCKSNGSFSFPS